MSAKRIKAARSTQWYSEHAKKIPHKVAWKVLGFQSPKAYREFRDARARHEGVFDRVTNRRVSGFTRRWVEAQPREYRQGITLRRFLDDRPYTVRIGDIPVYVAMHFSGQRPGCLKELADANELVSQQWRGWQAGVVIYLPSTWPPNIQGEPLRALSFNLGAVQT